MESNKIEGTSNYGWIYVILLIGCFLCCWTILKNGYAIGAVIACSPFLLMVAYYIFSKPVIPLFLFYFVNYLIFGAQRYGLFSIPITGIIDSFLAFLMIATILKSTFIRQDWERSRNVFMWVSFLWFLFCIIEILNNTTGEINLETWYLGVRSIAIYPLITAIFIPMLLNQYKYIHWFLIIWAFLTILASAKGYWQRNKGFDSYELTWLFSYGGRTHLIASGIRYFSFFSDANNFGSSMGFSLVTFGISSFYYKNKFLKIYFLLAALAGGYGMMISGTRGALAVPFAGFALFILISKSWKMTLGGILLLISMISFLKFTTIGESNVFIRRMRSAFDLNDASLQVRLHNRELLQKEMQNLPVGFGIGVNRYNTHEDNRYYQAVSTPPDSWLVTMWTRTGIIGLILYLGVQFSVIIYGSYLVIFKIKNKELRGIMIGMLCGLFGMIATSYSADSYTQFPNSFIIFTCQTLIAISPYFDRELSSKKKREKEINNFSIYSEHGKTTD